MWVDLGLLIGDEDEYAEHSHSIVACFNLLHYLGRIDQ